MKLKEEINRKRNMKYTVNQTFFMFMEYSVILCEQLKIFMKICGLRGKRKVI